MNYYERHLGDYARDTGHLSMIEHGAYNLLLDRYYATERGLPADQVHRLARAKSKDEKLAVDTVLSEFFTLCDGFWIKNRVEEEIAKARKSIDAARENGRKGGRPRKPDDNPAETHRVPIGLSLGSETETQTEPSRKLTRHQTPDTRDKEGAKALSALDLLAAEGVDEQVAKDWVSIRKAQKAPLTETAMAGVRREASNAGLTVAQAVQISVERGWRGFKADWLAADKRLGGAKAQTPQSSKSLAEVGLA